MIFNVIYLHNNNQHYYLLWHILYYLLPTKYWHMELQKMIMENFFPI